MMSELIDMRQGVRWLDEDPNHPVVMAMRGELRSWDAIKKFIFAGNSTFTIRSLKTGTRFTYRLRARKSTNNGNAILLRQPAARP